MKELKKLNHEFSVCKLATVNGIDWKATFTHLSKTDDELSLICLTGKEPADAIAVEAGWVALKCSTGAQLSLGRVIADIASRLEESHVSLFILSTFSTDHIFFRKRDYEKAVLTLTQAGYSIV